MGVGDVGKGGGQVNEFSGVVTDIREELRVAGRQRWQMALDRTEFVAGDVGMLEAVARSGAKLAVPVLAGTLARGCSTALCLLWRCAMRVWWGAVAQLGERLVRNEEVSGSIPLSSTIESRR
jgi:hypothetical protein